MNKDRVRKLIIDELDLHPQHPFWDKFEALQPIVPNEEVEEAMKLFDMGYEDSDMTKYTREDVDNAWETIKNFIQQSIATPKISEYTRLLDKIELKVVHYSQHNDYYYNIGSGWIMVNKKFYNILKELKSLGDK